MDELRAQFLIEGRDIVAQAAADFTFLSATPRDAASIDSAFRAIHTLKGSVAIFAMKPAERVLHAAEDVLEQARKGGLLLDATVIATLVNCLDHVDRWIDRLEQDQAMGPDDERLAAEAIAALPSQGVASLAPAADLAPQWLDALLKRETGIVADDRRPLVAFRYTPDQDCFFRGEDPLATVAAVPELVALAVLPIGEAWPALDAVEPFDCISIIEGLSAASADEVRAAFRLMPDQVALATVDPVVEPARAGPNDVRGTNVLRVDAARVDALADQLGQLIVATNGFASLAARAETFDRSLAAGIRALQADVERVAGDLHRGVAAVRLVPLAPVLRGLPRRARETAAMLGKQVAFVVSGDGMEVDKQIADGLFEPLLHLVRNAIDHGIETPGHRAEAGKPAEGRITLSAARDGDAILITLSDDGAGIDATLIRQVAVARGVLPAEEAESLSDDAARLLVFAPGFSTADDVTELSGRGVGMDAVRVAVEKLRGTIDLESKAGAGTTIRLRLPANALTTRLLVVEVGQDRYGVALDQVVETVRIDSAALKPVGDGLACVLRGRTVPVLSLASLLGGVERHADSAKLLITRAGGERVALRVDGFAERIDTLVRPPSGLLASVPGVTGAALTGDGGVLLVLDLPGLAA